MPVDCDHPRHSCAEVGCIGDPSALSERELWLMTRNPDAEAARVARTELVRRGVLGWCPSCRSPCFVLFGNCRGCGGRAEAALPDEQPAEAGETPCDLCNGTGFPGTTERSCPQCSEGSGA